MRVDDFNAAIRTSGARLVRRLRPYRILLVCAAMTAAAIGRATPAAAQTYTIEVQAGGGGTVTPDGFVSVPSGGTQVFQFVPNNCFVVTDVTVDDVSVGNVSSYTFMNVHSDHLLYVAFGPASYSITATAGAGGLISPSGTVSVTCGSDAHFDILPACTQRIASLLIDGAPVALTRSYTFANVRANHTIDVAFGPSTSSATLTVTPAAGVCTVPDTIVAVVDGADQGAVGFFDGDESVGGAYVVNGVATAIIDPPLVIGPHTLTARYVGSACSPPTVSPPIGYNVSPGSGTTVQAALTVTPNPATTGSLVTLVVNLTAPGVPPSLVTGAVEFLDGTTRIWVAAVRALSARFATIGFTRGQHTLTAHYSGNGCLAGATTAAVTLNVFGQIATVQASSTPNPSQAGQSVAMTAGVYVGGILRSNATGSVQFLEGTTVLGSAPVSAGRATLNYAGLAGGAHTITASYSGDAILSPASTTFTQTVIACPSTTQLTLNVSPNPAASGQNVFLAATLLLGGSPALVSGTINFLDGTNSIGSATLFQGVANLSRTFAPVGQHSLTAQYAGNGCLSPSTSAATVLVVSTRLAALAVTGTPNPAPSGTPVTVTATVYWNGLPATSATGTMLFFEGGTPLGSSTVSGGQATISLSTLTSGLHVIEARYSGDATYSSALWSYEQSIVGPPQLSLATSPNPCPFGANVQFTATLGVSVTGGTVTFFADHVSIGSVPMIQGLATFSYSGLAPGPHSVYAHFSGASGVPALDSDSLTQTTLDYAGALLRVLYPNGGERFVVGDTITIFWDPWPALFVPRISLYVSRHLPPDWETIVDDIPNTGAYRWTVTGPGTNIGPTERQSALIATGDLSGTVGSDASNMPFSIFDPSSAALANQFAAELEAVPTEFALGAPRPNPSAGSMSFWFAVPRLARVRLSVLDLQGREMAVLVDGESTPGRHVVSWHGRSPRGPVAPGIYLGCFDTPDRRCVTRIAILR